MTPASRLIEKCGGARLVAGWLGLSIVSVYRMTYSRERGGTGGIIPAHHQQILLDQAHAAGIDLTPADFFDDPAAGRPCDTEPSESAAKAPDPPSQAASADKRGEAA